MITRHAWILAALVACRGSNAESNKPEVAETIEIPVDKLHPDPVAPATSGSGGAEHRGGADANANPGGRAFAAFKETWVYVDGEPKGVMMFPEIPSWIPVAWADDIDGLDFDPSTPPDKRNKKVQLMRYRVSDYLTAIGVDMSKVKAVYIHGGGYTVLTPEMFAKFGNDITFDFTGNDMTKTRFYWPKAMHTNSNYDRYAALSVYVNKPVPKLNQQSQATIDGQEVVGIPYHGTPERGGVRVYVDGHLAYVIKRNLLSNVGRVKPDEPRWSLLKLLAANGVKADVAAIDVVSDKDVYNLHRDRVPEDLLKDPTFETSAAVSGEVIFGKDKLEVNAFLLYTRGHVPPVQALPPLERDWQATP